MLRVVIRNVVAKAIIIIKVPSLSVRMPPSSIPSGMAIHAPAVIAPKTRPRIWDGIRSNWIAPMIGFNGPAPMLVINVTTIRTHTGRRLSLHAHIATPSATETTALENDLPALTVTN